MGMEAKRVGAKLKKNKGLQSPGDTGLCLEFSVGTWVGGSECFPVFLLRLRHEHRHVSPQPSQTNRCLPRPLCSRVQTPASSQALFRPKAPLRSRDPSLWDSGPRTLLNSSSGPGPQPLVSCHILAVTRSLRSPG